MYYFGARLVMLSLTGSYLIPFILTPKDKSRINWNGKLLCGMATTRDIFRFGGILVLIYFHLMTVAKPYWSLPVVSLLRLATALLVFDETWGPRFSYTRMCGTVQFGEQCTRHPLLA